MQLLMNRARCRYYYDFIHDNSVDKRRLFKAAKALLTDSKTLSLPEGYDAGVVANDIGKFFVQKVHDIRVNLTNKAVFNESGELITDSHPEASFSDFKVLSTDDVRNIVI